MYCACLPHPLHVCPAPYMSARPYMSAPPLHVCPTPYMSAPPPTCLPRPYMSAPPLHVCPAPYMSAPPPYMSAPPHTCEPHPLHVCPAPTCLPRPLQMITSGGGCCDCGDSEAWTSGVYCSAHVPKEEASANEEVRGHACILAILGNMLDYTLTDVQLSTCVFAL